MRADLTELATRSVIKYFTGGTPQSFSITVNEPYAPSDFDQLCTPIQSPIYASLFRAYSEAIINSPGIGEDYVADVPKPSRPVGLFSLGAIALAGLCIGRIRMCRPSVS